MAKMTAAEKAKRTPKFFKKVFSSPRKEKAEAASKKATAESSMKKKVYAAESMFKSAKSRDDAKVAPGKARSFKQAFDAATKAGKDRFMLKGKSYLTTKGKRADRFDPTKIKGAEKKESIFSKFKSSKTGSEFFKKLKKKK